MKNYQKFIIYEDDDILIVNKPAGMLCIADGHRSELPFLKHELEETYGRIWTVHRLDKATSGVLVFAKNDRAHRDLNRQFEHHLVQKNYRAISHGFPLWNHKIFEMPLRKNVGSRHRTVSDVQRGKPAITRFVVLQRCQSFCELDVFPLSGITHQIRSHAAMLGLPIFGDELYGQFHPPYPLKMRQLENLENRLYLHALSICFHHPKDQAITFFAAPLPDSFQFSNFQIL